MRTTIVGLGLIGGSLAKDLRKTNFATELIGVEANPIHSKKALELGLVDRIETLENGVKDTDIVIIAIPVDKELTVLPLILDLIDNGTTVTDMGSTKRAIIETVKNHPRRKNFVPAHPMSGTENSGPEAALEDLFKGKITILCDQDDTGPQHLFVSHLPHAAAYALANAVQSKEDRNIIFDLASGGFQSTVRLAKSSSSMWHPIFQQNRNYVVESLDVYIKHLKEFRDCLQNEDDERMHELIVNANKIRGILEGETHNLVKNEEKLVKFYTK